MDAQTLKNKVEKVRTMLSNLKSHGEVVIYSIVLDAELNTMGADGAELGEALKPLFERRLLAFKDDPNSAVFMYRGEGRA